MFKRLILILVLLCSNSLAQELSIEREDSFILERFFRVLVEESETGYVLHGKKPVSIHAFFHKDPFSINTVAHKHSVALKEGARVWPNFSSSQGEFLVYVSSKEDPMLPNWIHVISMNRPLLRKVLKEHFSLFQYVLGPSISPDRLLERLSSDEATFHTLLAGNKVLIGEILGFGTQNSLYVSRIENIEESLERSFPPFLSTHSIVREYSDEFLPLEPGFGFQSIRHELEALQEKIAFPSEKLVQEMPEFVFGCLKGTKETRKFVSDLERVQLKIQKLLRSSNWLGQVLQKVTGQKYSTCLEGEGFQFHLDGDKLNLAMARGIWESLQRYDQESLTHFIDGLGSEAPNGHCLIDPLAYFPTYLREVREAKEYLISAERQFAQFDQEPSFGCIIPRKLYYKTIEDGVEGGIECVGPFVTIDYTILSSLCHCVAHQSNLPINLRNTIPGFALGLKGMRIGETRELYIHPSLCCGTWNSPERRVPFRAIVTLRQIHDNQPYNHPIGEYHSSSILEDRHLEESIRQYRLALFEKGRALADHLKKCREIDLALICNELKRFHSGNAVFVPTTEREQEMINQAHWNIYFGSPHRM